MESMMSGQKKSGYFSEKAEDFQQTIEDFQDLDLNEHKEWLK